MSAGLPWRGARAADVLVLDVTVLGETECRRRAIASWQPGATVHALPDGRWALRLPTAVPVRAELAPGVPLVLAAGDVLRWTWHGRAVSSAIDDLPLVDTARWVDLSGLPVEHLVAIEPPPEEPDVVPDELRAETQVDLAARAGVGRDGRRTALAAQLAARVAGSRGTGAATGGAGRRGRGAGDGPGRVRSDVLARLVLRGPVGGLVARRHARYVADLAREFEAGRYEEALRRAISLAGGVGALSLRLPAARRADLRLTTGPAGRGTTLAVGRDTIEAALARHYQDAAARLERDGRVEEAAYVLADLLDRPLDAVRMLERQGRVTLAAELAESRPALGETAVRLWWKLGERERAVGLARRRGTFAQVAALLGPAEDREWRREWVRFCRDVGDPVGAVRAAWPQAALRDEVQDDLAAAMSLGGPDGGEMFALAVTHRPTPAAVATAVDLLGRADTGERDGRTGVVLTLARWPVADAVADRRLTTAASRLLVREPGMLAELPPQTAKSLVRDLHARADPLAVADLVRPGRARRRTPSGAQAHGLPGRGELAVLDAALVRPGVLVAHGDGGTRLYGPAGQVLARWDVPATRLVVADHGAVALLVVDGERASELHRLDLATRRTTRWAVVAVRRLSGTFDGASLVVVDDGGLAAWDTTGAGPRVVWRQRLAKGEQVLDLARDPHSLAATIRADGSGELQPGVHVWRWSQPDGLLRARAVVDVGTDPVDSAALSPYGQLLTTSRRGGGAYLRRCSEGSPPVLTRLHDPTTTVVGAGTAVATLVSTADGVRVSGDPSSAGGWSAHVPDAEAVKVRWEGRFVVVCTRDGRVLAFDVGSGRVEARFATLASPRARAAGTVT